MGDRLLEERPPQAEWRFGEKLEEMQRIPGAYLLIARLCCILGDPDKEVIFMED